MSGIVEAADLDFPRYFQIETVRACNSRCPFCPYGVGRIQNTGFMPEPLYAKIEGEILAKARDVRRVTLNIMGEPLLDKRIVDRVASLKRGGVAEVAFASNVSLLSEPSARALLEAGLDIIKMSITSVVREKYGKLRIGLDFDEVMNNAERYFALRDEIRPDSSVVVSMERHSSLGEEDVERWKEYWRPWLKATDALVVSDLFNCTDYGAVEAMGSVSDKPCEALLQSMLIAYDGVVHLCCRDFFDDASRFPVGNAKTRSIHDIWRGEAFTRYRQWHRAGQRKRMAICNGCTAWDGFSKKRYG